MNKSRDYRHLANMLREIYPEVIAMTDIPHEAYMAAQAIDELMDYIQSIEATPPAAQPAPSQPLAKNICTECANSDSWGLPDKTVCRSCVSNSEWSPLNRSSVNPITPPAAQRQWVDLSRKDEQEIKSHCTTIACVLKAVKYKLKEKNT